MKVLFSLMVSLLVGVCVFAKEEKKSPARDVASAFTDLRAAKIKEITDMYSCTYTPEGAPAGKRSEFEFGGYKPGRLTLVRRDWEALKAGEKADDQVYKEEVHGKWGFSAPEADLLVCFGSCKHGSPDWRKFDIDKANKTCKFQ